MELVKNSPKDVYATIQQTILAILTKMDAILNMEKSGSHVGDHSQHNDFKSLLCAALQVYMKSILFIHCRRTFIWPLLYHSMCKCLCIIY